MLHFSAAYNYFSFCNLLNSICVKRCLTIKTQAVTHKTIIPNPIVDSFVVGGLVPIERFELPSTAYKADAKPTQLYRHKNIRK